MSRRANVSDHEHRQQMAGEWPASTSIMSTEARSTHNGEASTAEEQCTGSCGDGSETAGKRWR